MSLEDITSVGLWPYCRSPIERTRDPMLILSIKRKAGYYRDSLEGIKSSLSLRESNFNRSSLDLKFAGG